MPDSPHMPESPEERPENLPPPSSALLPDPERLQAAVDGDEAAAGELDACGLLIGGLESPEQWVERIRKLTANIERMEAQLAETRQFTVEDVCVQAGDRIPQELFGAAGRITEALYGFRADWVPGFFVNPSFGWLFGGCAFYFYPDFFAMFIIRRAFAQREKWLFYDRVELLAHELCHVARVGFTSRRFEEMLAYQTATSHFRRVAGGVFRSPVDGYVLLGATWLLLLAQVLRFSVLLWLPGWPFWLLVIGVIGFFAIRHGRDVHIFAKATRNLERIAPGAARSVLFRCTDEEIDALAGLDDADALAQWLDYRVRSSRRWQLIRDRFFPPPAQ